MGGVGVEEASAVGAQFLDGFLRGHRSLRDDLLGAFHGGDGGVGLQILNHALRAQKQRADERYRQQHVQRGARHVHPEIAQGPYFMAREASDHGNRDRQARRGRYEILHRQRGHLHEIAERGFSAIGLPVGVRQKADGGVEGQVGSDIGRAKVLRIERQISLRALQQVHQQEAENAEGQQRRSVLRPALLDILANAGDLIGQHFQPAQHGMQKGAPSLEHIRHEGAQRLYTHQDQREEQRDLQKFQY